MDVEINGEVPVFVSGGSPPNLTLSSSHPTLYTRSESDSSQGRDDGAAVEPQVARTARAVHFRTSGIGRTYCARTPVTRSRSRRRGDVFFGYCCTPQWFEVNPLLDMRTDRRSGIGRSNRDSSDQGNSMGLPVREYTGSPNKPLHSECAYREGVSPRYRIALTARAVPLRHEGNGIFLSHRTFQR
jgi:hypothetical protein